MDAKVRSFLDGLKLPGCLLACHDANHDSDYDEGGCGNPQCWKYNPKTSPPAHPIRPFGCRCPWTKENA